MSVNGSGELVCSRLMSQWRAVEPVCEAGTAGWGCDGARALLALFPHRAESRYGVSAGQPLVSEGTWSGCRGACDPQACCLGPELRLYRRRELVELALGRGEREAQALLLSAGCQSPQGPQHAGRTRAPQPCHPASCCVRRGALHSPRSPVTSHSLLLRPRFNDFFPPVLVSLKSGRCVDVIGSIFS